MKKNVFVIGLNEFNLNMLRHLRGADEIEFHGLLDPALFYETEEFDIPSLLKAAEEQLNAFDGSIDGIAGYMDFPVSTMLPIICERFDTASVSLEALLKCEHKYWSRLCQREAIPDHIPGFKAFDPFDNEALAHIGLGFPFFVKPIKGSGSRLGFRIDKPEDFDYAIERLRAEIGTISEPFDYILDQLQLPPDVSEIGGHYCIAEEIIGGRQCTMEGYVYDGKVTCTGLVDSIRYPQVLSFFRYQYPSRLPERIQDEMARLTDRIMTHVGYNNSSFNIEYFWDEQLDKVWLLEVNTRISQSHSDIFEKVDGVSNQQLTIDLALGRHPNMPSREGQFPIASKFFHRVFSGDARVKRAPTKEEIQAIQKDFPGTYILPQVEPGDWLSDLPEQDSYSYALAYIYMGAQDEESLLSNYERVLERLPFELEKVDDTFSRPAEESQPPA
ncbi:ATP-grasp domain-containing protein [Halofilum ochraceum]|uniref:ATP-grasp domain-containing protein n=1 Tax=Halofilum ochraceum TaxID=1611323 RepID=UPI000832DC44|nr:ATP-grasp domain-containing protein [Halofilum ochraceum]